MKDHPPLVLTVNVDDLVELVAERVIVLLGRQTSPMLAVYTCTTLAADLGVTPRAIRAAISRGELRAVKRGGRWLIPAGAVSDWTTGTPIRGQGMASQATRRSGATRRTGSTTPTLTDALRALDDGG
jgi:excisionase family DNA binding protein